MNIEKKFCSTYGNKGNQKLIPMEEENEISNLNSKLENSIHLKEINTPKSLLYSNSNISTNNSFFSSNSNIQKEKTKDMIFKISKINKPLKNIKYLFNIEYFDEIYINLLIDEKHSKLKIKNYYMKMQTDIDEQMRAILVDWLLEVHFRLNFKKKTLYQTIFIIDLYLSYYFTPKSKLQLLGISCLLISAKENEIYIPKLEEFIKLTDNAYNKNDLIKMENQVLGCLNFEILVPTTEEFYDILSNNFNFNNEQRHLGELFIDSSLLDYGMLKYKYSTIAIACIYIVMKFYNLNGYKNIYSSKFILGDSSKKIVKECAKNLCYLVKNIYKSSLNAIRCKYSIEKYNCVFFALCEEK